MLKHIATFAACLALICATSFAMVPAAFAQQRTVTLVIDAEIDDYLKELATPLLKAAAINPDNIRVHLIKDDTINAFVNSQRDIYVNSGLILKADTENEVVGVLAHEIGHMKGHHILRIMNAQDQLTVPLILSGLVGIGVAAAGAPNAGVAVLAGGQAAGISNLLRFSRSQEQQADQIGVNLLNDTNASTQGLKDFFNRLRTNELMYYKTPPAYLMTHPRSSDREGFLERSETKPHVVSVTEAQRFARIQAKVAALTASSSQVLRQYMNESGPAADYVRSVIYAMDGKYDEALTSLNKAEADLLPGAAPYVAELRGQIDFEKGSFESAREHFGKAVELQPKSAILRFHYARTLAALEDYKEAITQFDRVARARDGWWLPLYHQGLAYGKSGRKGLSHLAFAESNLYRGQIKDGLFHVSVAEKYLKDEEKENNIDNTLSLQKAAQIKLELEKLSN